WATAVTVMPRGPASRVTDVGPRLNRSRIARRVGSPRAWNKRSMSMGDPFIGEFLSGRSLCEFLLHAVEKGTPSCFEHLRPVRPIQERSLMGEGEVRPCRCGQKLERRQHNHNGLSVKRHLRGHHNVLLGHDVLIGAFVRNLGTRNGVAFLETVPEPFAASHAKLHLKFLNLVVPLGVPPPLAGRLCKGGKDALRGLGIVALNDEGAVNYRLVCHTSSPLTNVYSEATTSVSPGKR